MAELDHKNFLLFISQLTAVAAGYNASQLTRAKKIAQRDYPALVPIIDEYIKLACNSKLRFGPVDKPRGRTRPNESEMHLFDLLRSRKLFPLNRDLSDFASRVLPGMTIQRFAKLSMGDIAARIIEYLETKDPKTREKLEASMKSAWNSKECPEAKSHDEADLCEQRRMSKAADDSVSLNKVQVLLGIAGFLALLVTIGLTYRATSAAIESNKIASDTAKRELRAYVFAKCAILSKGENFFRATVTIHNFGHTPAYRFDHFAIIEWTWNPRSTPFIGGVIEAKRTDCIPPGSHVGVVIESGAMPEVMMKSIESGSAMLWVWGEIYYEDAFGRQQITKYRFMYNGATAKTQSSGVMMTNPEGNEAT